MTICAVFVRLLSVCTEINDWKMKHLYFLTYSGVECLESAMVSSMDSIGKTFSTVEDLPLLNIFLCDFDIVEGKTIGELTRWSLQKHKNTVRLLKYKNHICYVNNLNAVFQCFRFPNGDNLLNRTFILERKLTTCSEQVKNVYRRNVYQFQGTLFDKLGSFGIKYTTQQKFPKILAMFDFESFCVQEETFRDTNTT